MSKPLMIGMAVAALLLTAVASAQRPERRREEPKRGPEHEMVVRHHEMAMEAEEAERGMAMRQREMALEAEEAERAFEREMRELELQARRAEVERRLGGEGDGGGALVLLLLAVVHILLTVWVYQDMHARNAGAGLWIAITLLTGFLGALLYALVRLGDMRREAS